MGAIILRDGTAPVVGAVGDRGTRARHEVSRARTFPCVCHEPARLLPIGVEQQQLWSDADSASTLTDLRADTR